jgi:hypothetical protein
LLKGSLPDKIQDTWWVWWYIPVILVLRRQSQEDEEFKASLDYIVKNR